jgi:hypothetical protein
VNRSLEIGGDATLNQSSFGSKIVGLGHFYSVTVGTTLIVSAPGIGDATSVSDNEGRLYAFHGQGPGSAIGVVAADSLLVGPAKAAKIGGALFNLGPIVNTLSSLGSGNPTDVTSGGSGSALVLSGTNALGPFANSLTIIQSSASGVGQVLFGGGISGRDVVMSLIGDAKPDLGLTSTTSTTLDIVDGNKVASLTGRVDTKTVADVHVPMPPGWLGTAAGTGNLIKDINGDGAPDFALGDQFGTVPGRVVVFW